MNYSFIQKKQFCLGVIAALCMSLIVQCTNSRDSIMADADGIIHLTAENGKGLGPKIEYMPEWKAFGWFTGKDSVVWKMEIKEPRDFEVEMEWSVSDEEAGKPFVFYSGKQQITGTVKKSGSWETFQKEKIGTIRLPSGEQKLVFKSKMDFEEGALLDLRALKLIPIN